MVYFRNREKERILFSLSSSLLPVLLSFVFFLLPSISPSTPQTINLRHLKLRSCNWMPQNHGPTISVTVRWNSVSPQYCSRDPTFCRRCSRVGSGRRVIKTLGPTWYSDDRTVKKRRFTSQPNLTDIPGGGRGPSTLKY